MSIETIDRIADVTAGSNSLPVLAARIRHYHAATAESLRCSVENAMCAGDALLEAKIAVPHGQWLPWLAEHCKLSERSAQLYMQIARNREAIEAKFTDGVEDLTLNQAAGLMMLTADVKKALEWARKLQMINDPEKVVALCIEYGYGVFQTPGYDMWAGVADADRPDWYLFTWFLIVNENAMVERGGLFEHIEWILQHQFKTVDEWLGPEGDGFRNRTMPEGFKKRWRAFHAEHAGMTIAEIEAEITKIADWQRENPVPERKAKRGRR